MHLQLKEIRKTYVTGGNSVEALKGVSLSFRKAEFVSVLGPSGCGKTTMLNIVGGLDRYDGGDLVIDGISTENFKAADWDAYRNRSIGFVFQNYNLISHQSVLSNVEIAMTLSGVSPSERRKRAEKALRDVGLSDQMTKRPNQLSGGQMQRVAIARALVNNPDIILADEPTGALDTRTSIQIMEILREVAGTRLVIMVTHNPELADKYSTRIVRLLDGRIDDDSNPPRENEEKSAAAVERDAATAFAENERARKARYKKTSMSFPTALSLSFKNLLTKKGRTIITAIAGSIGIIGVSLVLALSGGMKNQVDRVTAESMSNYPVTVDQVHVDYNSRFNGGNLNRNEGYSEFPDEEEVYAYQNASNDGLNVITPELLRYVEALPAEVCRAVSYTYGMRMNILLEKSGVYSAVWPSPDRWQELPSNLNYVSGLYDVLAGLPNSDGIPKNKNQIGLVVDNYNRVPEGFLRSLGLDTVITPDSNGRRPISFGDILGTKYKVVMNGDFWKERTDTPGFFSAQETAAAYNGADAVEIEVVGVLRIKEGLSSNLFPRYGLVYHPDLSAYYYEKNGVSLSGLNFGDLSTPADFPGLLAQNPDLAAQLSRNPVFAAQLLNPTKNVTSNPGTADFSSTEITVGGSIKINLSWIQRLQELGGNPFEMLPGAGISGMMPTGIRLYPADFNAKKQLKLKLDEFNVGRSEAMQIKYNDLVEAISGAITTMIDTISYALVAFAAISLVVSSIMIGIITYVSVIERTKEIGILRSVGARKKDISRVFNAETIIVGFAAGLIGVFTAWLMTFPINAIVRRIVSDFNLDKVANLSPLTALLMVILSMGLTLVAGLIPSRKAAKKDPVAALRTE